MLEKKSIKTGSYRLFALYFFVIALAMLSALSGNEMIRMLAQGISNIFVKLFQMLATPIISLSLIVTISTFAEGSLGKIWRRILLYTISTTLIAASISALLYSIIKPQNVNGLTQASMHSSNTQTTYLSYLSSLIPNNFVSPFIEHQVISILIISLVIGLAIRFIPDKTAKETVTAFFRGIHGIFFVLTKWLITILPLGLYGFITTTLYQLNTGVHLRGLGAYLAVVVMANLIQGFIVLPLWLMFNGINPLKTMNAMLPALSLGFFSKSSAGTLPVTMETAEKRLKLNPRISRFVLPLCTTINMNACAAFIFATVIFLMQNNGMALGPITLLSWIVIATIAAIGNAGVPMGCFFLSLSLLSSMNVPIELMGLILPFYSVIDMLETTLNIWSDSCVAAVVDKKLAGSLPDTIPEVAEVTS